MLLKLHAFLSISPLVKPLYFLWSACDPSVLASVTICMTSSPVYFKYSNKAVACMSGGSSASPSSIFTENLGRTRSSWSNDANALVEASPVACCKNPLAAVSIFVSISSNVSMLGAAITYVVLFNCPGAFVFYLFNFRVLESCFVCHLYCLFVFFSAHVQPGMKAPTKVFVY